MLVTKRPIRSFEPSTPPAALPTDIVDILNDTRYYWQWRDGKSATSEYKRRSIPMSKLVAVGVSKGCRRVFGIPSRIYPSVSSLLRTKCGGVTLCTRGG
jgi:hypothetical protein